MGIRKCYNCDQPGHMANGCPYPPKCQICGALHKLEDCPAVKDLIEKRQSGQSAQTPQPRASTTAQQPVQQNAVYRTNASGQQRTTPEPRAPSSANRGNALSLLREDESDSFLPLFATASQNEVRLYAENADEMPQETTQTVVESVEPQNVVARPREMAPVVSRCDGAVTPWFGVDVC